MRLSDSDTRQDVFLLPAREAARALSISERTLWSLSAPRGPIPVVRVGHRVMYDPADLRAWIARQKVREAEEA